MNEPLQTNREPTLTPKQAVRLALSAVVPFYLLIGAVIRLSGGAEPLLADHLRFLLFIVFCAAGLAGAVFSFPARRLLDARAEASGRPAPLRAALIALIFCEIPALLGLVYYILFRDWTGFLILLAVSYGGFAFHRRQAT